MYAPARFLRAAGGATGLARAFHTGRALLKAVELPVPKMGDSITEGTLLKILKEPGQAVALDEIIAVIETDKVTVDVRAPEAGVVTAVHAKPQDTVAVGAKLFTLDNEGKASAAAPAAAPALAAAAPAPAPAAAAPAPAAAPVQPASASSHRKPSIHFRYGKRDDIDAAAGHGASAPAKSAGPTAAYAGDYMSMMASLFPSKPGAKDALSVSPSFGRPAMSVQEMFAIDTGGCEWVPPPPEDKKKGKKA